MERRETTANEHWTVKAVFAFVLTCWVGAEIALYSGLAVLHVRLLFKPECLRSRLGAKMALTFSDAAGNSTLRDELRSYGPSTQEGRTKAVLR
jgi:hypothetical protein